MRLPADTDAPACRAASVRVLLHAVVLAGVVAFALLLATGLPRTFGDPVSPGHAVPTVAQAEVPAVETVQSADPAAASVLAEIDDVAGDPRTVEPVPSALPRFSATGFGPFGDTLPPVRDILPPDRPPRNA